MCGKHDHIGARQQLRDITADAEETYTVLQPEFSDKPLAVGQLTPVRVGLGTAGQVQAIVFRKLPHRADKCLLVFLGAESGHHQDLVHVLPGEVRCRPGRGEAPDIDAVRNDGHPAGKNRVGQIGVQRRACRFADADDLPIAPVHPTVHHPETFPAPAPVVRVVFRRDEMKRHKAGSHGRQHLAGRIMRMDDRAAVSAQIPQQRKDQQRITHCPPTF